MKVFDFPLVKLTISLILGISLGAFFEVSLKASVFISAILLGLLLVLKYILRKSFYKTIWYGLLSFITMIAIGIATYNLHQEQHFKAHYSNHFSTKNPSIHITEARISDVLKSNASYNRYVVDVAKIDTLPVVGKLLVSIKKDSMVKPLHIDSKIVIAGRLQELYPPLNPFQFDYKAYLNRHDVYAQIYCDSHTVFVTNRSTSSIYGFADHIRETIISRLENYHMEPREMSIIKALLLGQRYDISNELRQQYIDAGAIHILAISGLHIGIVLWILNAFFGFMNRFKHGHVLKSIILLIILWCFALIAGLSPSVLRAVTMFSFFAVAINLKRPYNIYNTLAISAFVLLLANPMLLFEVGFQLSYLAVIGIISIQPKLYKLLKTKFWLPNKIWEFITVSIAAQLGVLPLSLYYFHQFPGLFFLSNVVIIPVLGFILGCGFVVIIMGLFQVPDNFVVWIFETSIRLMNEFFNWVALQEAFIFKDIPFSFVMVLSSYVLILGCYRVFADYNFKNVVLAFSTLIIFQGVYFFQIYYKNQDDKLIVFHKSRYTIIGERQGRILHVSHKLDSVSKGSDYIIKSYELGNFISKRDENNLQNVYKHKNNIMLVVDSLNVYQNLTFYPDYVVLSQSPKINLNRLIDRLNPKTIIADGSNYKSYIKRWEQTCKKRKIPFHYTGEKGAFILD